MVSWNYPRDPSGSPAILELPLHPYLGEPRALPTGYVATRWLH